MAAAPQLCAVTIGADHFLLPLKDGTRLLEILGRAVPLDRTYSVRRPCWRAKQSDAGRFELAIVRADDIDVAEVAVQRGRRALRLALPGGR